MFKASIVEPCCTAQVVLKLSTCRGAPSAGITSVHRHAQAEVALFCEPFRMEEESIENLILTPSVHRQLPKEDV